MYHYSYIHLYIIFHDEPWLLFPWYLSDWTLNGIDCTLFDTAEEVRREFYMDKVHYLTTYMYEHVACQVTT